MKAENLKRITLIVAVLTLAIVWLRNIDVLTGKSAVPEADLTITGVQTEHELPDGRGGVQLSDFSYDRTLRDPFSLPSIETKRKPARKAPRTAPPDLSSPQASLQGFVWEEGAARLILYDSVSRTSTVYSAGDTINDYLIKQISRDEVTLVHGKKSVVWKVDD